MRCCWQQQVSSVPTPERTAVWVNTVKYLFNAPKYSDRILYCHNYPCSGGLVGNVVSFRHGQIEISRPPTGWSAYGLESEYIMQRILIVEDEIKTGSYLRQGLEEVGYHVELFQWP